MPFQNPIEEEPWKNGRREDQIYLGLVREGWPRRVPFQQRNRGDLWKGREILYRKLQRLF